jgi:transposase
MRVAKVVLLDAKTREQLERLSRGRTVAFRVVQRCCIILLAADGLQNRDISERLHVSRQMVSLWRNRFIKSGVTGLMQDAPRPGRTPSISSSVIDTVIEKTTRSAPEGATHWSTRKMASVVGISETSVRRIWKMYGLKPHLIPNLKSGLRSTDDETDR